MSAAPLSAAHPDYAIVAALVAGVLKAGKGFEQFSSDIPGLFRTAIDEVIDAPRTNRFTLSETEKTEKTYLGTKIEILLRNHLELPKGKTLDLNIDGIECDIKNTMGVNWSIPQENVGRPAILIRQNDKTARCDFGIAVLRDSYLNKGHNQDKKRGLAAAHFGDVWWILKDHRYPANFWEVLPKSTRDEITAAGAGTARVAKLFDLVRNTPVSRTQVQAIAQQHDYMKRIRRHGGARDLLAPKGIAILWGQGDRDLITKLGLGNLYADEFISYKATDPSEIALLRSANHID